MKDLKVFALLTLILTMTVIGVSQALQTHAVLHPPETCCVLPPPAALSGPARPPCCCAGRCNCCPGCSIPKGARPALSVEIVPGLPAAPGCKAPGCCRKARGCCADAGRAPSPAEGEALRRGKNVIAPDGKGPI